MAQVSHSTSQLHMATAFHFFRENILSPPDLEPDELLCDRTKPGSSPSSISAAKRWKLALACLYKMEEDHGSANANRVSQRLVPTATEEGDVCQVFSAKTL